MQISVADPDPVGSAPLCRIRIRTFFGRGSGSRILDYKINLFGVEKFVLHLNSSMLTF
jgi:hypothetical protein